MNNYVDYKCTIWGRLIFNDNADMNKIVEKLKEGASVNDLCTEENGFEYDDLDRDTETFIEPEDNGGACTIEVYTGEGSELIYTNTQV